MSRNIVVLTIVVVVLLAITAALYQLGVRGGSRGQTTMATSGATSSGVASAASTSSSLSPEYNKAVEALKELLREAKRIYTRAVERNESWRMLFYEPYSNLSRSLVLGAKVLNQTILSINNTLYRYVIVHLYSPRHGVVFTPNTIQLDGVLVKTIPRNKSITYTGIVPHHYLVSYGGKSYRVSFSSMSFVDASYDLTVSTRKITDDAYAVRITIREEAGGSTQISTAWLILIKAASNNHE